MIKKFHDYRVVLLTNPRRGMSTTLTSFISLEQRGKAVLVLSLDRFSVLMG
jgi:trehalose-6-phosphate synthase